MVSCKTCGATIYQGFDGPPEPCPKCKPPTVQELREILGETPAEQPSSEDLPDQVLVSRAQLDDLYCAIIGKGPEEGDVVGTKPNKMLSYMTNIVRCTTISLKELFPTLGVTPKDYRRYFDPGTGEGISRIFDQAKVVELRTKKLRSELSALNARTWSHYNKSQKKKKNKEG